MLELYLIMKKANLEPGFWVHNNRDRFELKDMHFMDFELVKKRMPNRPDNGIPKPTRSG